MTPATSTFNNALTALPSPRDGAADDTDDTALPVPDPRNPLERGALSFAGPGRDGYLRATGWATPLIPDRPRGGTPRQRIRFVRPAIRPSDAETWRWWTGIPSLNISTAPSLGHVMTPAVRDFLETVIGHPLGVHPTTEQTPDDDDETEQISTVERRLNQWQLLLDHLETQIWEKTGYAPTSDHLIWVQADATCASPDALALGLHHLNVEAAHQLRTRHGFPPRLDDRLRGTRQRAVEPTEDTRDTGDADGVPATTSDWALTKQGPLTTVANVFAEYNRRLGLPPIQSADDA